LANALLDIFGVTNKINIIGTRHGEKLYESLLSKEEAVKAIDMGDYYRVPADTRDLNYSKYFENGNVRMEDVYEYNSHNTHRLSKEELYDLLLNLPYIKKELSNQL
jgi:UDP-glucose 4-epimerase